MVENHGKILILFLGTILKNLPEIHKDDATVIKTGEFPLIPGLWVRQGMWGKRKR